MGNLHMLGELPHQDLHRLAKIYGPIMYMRFALVPTFVVSSPQAAEEILKTHDHVFAGRPPSEASRIVSYGQKGLSFADYGPYWRNMRKLCTLGLLSNRKISSFQSLRREELGLLVDSLKEAALARAPVDITAKISSLSADISCRMIFGKKYMDKDLDERGFKAVIQEGMQLAAAPNMGDFIPFMASLDVQGLNRRLKDIHKVFDAFFEKIIDEHIHEAKAEGQSKDLVDIMLGYMESRENEYHFERSNIKAIVLVSMRNYFLELQV